MNAETLYDRPIRGVPAETAQSHADSAVRCPVCVSAAPRPAFQMAGFNSLVWRCPDCGLGWVEPQPTAAELESFYPGNYYGDSGQKFNRWIEPAVRFIAARHVRFLTRRLPRGAPVLDVGCGRGVLLRELAERGFEPHGTEISAAALQGIDPRVQTHICSRLTEANFAPDYFAQVILWHVLEHLPDPAQTLREVHRILAPSGSLVVAVPNFSSWQARWAGPDWFHLDLPRHLYHFSLQALERMVTDAGFVVTSRHHFSLRQNPFGWVQSVLNRYGRMPRNSLYEWLHRDQPRAGSMPWTTQLFLLSAFVIGMPIALAAEILAAACRQGATVHIVAQKSVKRTAL